MKKDFVIQVKRVDNGFIAGSQNDEDGIKNKRQVAITEEDVKKLCHDYVDHMFDAPPPKATVKGNPDAKTTT